jgi:glycosyltransferase involved in cell wall biosynthesis
MPQKTLSISLVIPVYNEESYLAACLEAATHQAEPFDEIIVVDNNSTDGSAMIAASYPGVKVLHEPKQGVVHARNTGFAAARGDIIARIDADTLVPADWTQKAQEIFADPAVDAVSGRMEYYDMAAQRFCNWIDLWFRRYFARVLGREVALQAANMAIRRSVWQNVCGSLCNRSGQHEDLDLAVHTNQAGHRVVFDERLVAAIGYRQGDSGFRTFCVYAWLSPRTYGLHGRASRFWMYPVVALAIIFYTVLKVLHRGYDMDTEKFSWRKILAPAPDMRVNPATYVD